MKKVKLPDGATDVRSTMSEFAPDRFTMARFDAEPSALWRACDEWL
jgi:hypothetical protein